ncbi:hypothetical protein LZ554_005060 [Drepanopeziza brunnea f. sp. 'monogermtubi']|nr:hypothetical protein LZ554_005060 [Drepanopeziza brunnea f. sp. 'monogermtubi']
MSIPALVQNHTGKSVYTTPPQSPPTAHSHDPPANPDDLEDIKEEDATDDDKRQSIDAIMPLGDKGTNGAIDSDRQFPPEIPARPGSREFPIFPAVKKEPPQLPARAPEVLPIHPPKPIPDLPPRAAPASPVIPGPAVPPRRIPKVDEPNNHCSLKYSRDPERMIAYLIPLPKPKYSEKEDEMPERFLVYTPPQPHFLKPAEGVKEPKKQRGKRKLQEEVQKAEKYDGKTMSWRGLHSKTTKGVVWAIRRIKTTDITFLGRIQNKEVDEIVLIYPGSVQQTVPEIHAEFIARIGRSKKRATRDAAISTALLPVTLVIDTVAVVFWPFGGLFEVDAVWAYASIKAWNTSRVITKRLGVRESRFGRFGGTERDLRLRFHEEAKVDVLRRSLADACHRADPQMFESAGVPPTETEVIKAIGWVPVRRGKTGGEREEGETGWADEEWQRAAFGKDYRASMDRGAESWVKWCKKFEKNPEKMLKK